MALTLILGGKKSGKTSYVLDKIKNSSDATLIVPEQNMFFYEKKVLKSLGESKAFLLETLSFMKLSKKLMKKEDDYNLLKLLNNDTKNLLLNKIILSKKGDLKIFKNSVHKTDFSQRIASQITELKKYMVPWEKLNDISCNDTLSPALREKLSDLSVLYHEYENQLKELFRDSDDLITSAAKEILKEHLFCMQTVFIDGFTGFTGQELLLIQALLLNQADVTVTLLLEEERGKNFGDLFYTTSLTKKKLEKLANENHIPVEIVVLNQNKYLSEEFAHLEKYLYSMESEVYEKPLFDIELYSFKNIYFECHNLVSKIITIVNEEKAQLKHFAVAVPDLKVYKRYLEELFREYNLPYYLNEKVAISDLPVAALIHNVLDLVTASNNMDLLLSYLKSGYLIKENFDKIYQFENFLFTTGVKVYELFSNKDITEIIEEKKSYGFFITGETDIIEVFEKTILPLKELREEIKGKQDAFSYSIALYEFIKKIELEQTIVSYAKDFDEEGNLIKGEQFVQVYNSIVESFERAAIILQKEQINFQTYKNILKMNMQNKSISSIPLLMDSVFITEINRLSSNDFKYLFILGANEGAFPKTAVSEGLLNEDDRACLSEYGVNLSMSCELKILEEYLKVYDLLLSPSSKLTISYPSFSFASEELLPSPIVVSIQNLFSNLKTKTTQEARCETKRLLFKKSIENALQEQNEFYIDSLKYFLKEENYQEITQKLIDQLGTKINQNVTLSKELVEKLVGEEITGSVTRFEKYRSCGFSYYIKYLLKANEKKGFLVDFANIGSLRHLVLEEFSNTVKEDKIAFSQVTDQYIEEKLDKIVKKAVKKVHNGVFLSSKRYYFLVKKVKRSVKRSIHLIKLHFTKGDFAPLGFELSFGNPDSDLKGITIQLSGDRKIHLTGVIDRVDILKNEDSEYVRIVDYKSSYKTLDFYEIYYGLNIQLAVYMLTMLSQETTSKIKPGGVLYLTLDEPIISISNPTETEDLELQIRKKLIMKGILLNDLSVMESMDKELLNLNSSDIIDINLDKTGNLNGKNTLTLKQFHEMLDGVLETIKKLSEQIYQGEFSIKPTKTSGKNACQYCPYGSICCFDNENCSFDELPKLSKDAIFSSKEDESNE